MFVVVYVVHPPLSCHDVGHLFQEYSVVSLHCSQPLFLHLHLLQLQVKVHVRLRRFVVDHRLCIPHLRDQCE